MRAWKRTTSASNASCSCARSRSSGGRSRPLTSHSRPARHPSRHLCTLRRCKRSKRHALCQLVDVFQSCCSFEAGQDGERAPKVRRTPRTVHEARLGEDLTQPAQCRGTHLLHLVEEHHLL